MECELDVERRKTMGESFENTMGIEDEKKTVLSATNERSRHGSHF